MFLCLLPISVTSLSAMIPGSGGFSNPPLGAAAGTVPAGYSTGPPIYKQHHNRIDEEFPNFRGDPDGPRIAQGTPASYLPPRQLAPGHPPVYQRTPVSNPLRPSWYNLEEERSGPFRGHPFTNRAADWTLYDTYQSTPTRRLGRRQN